MAASSVTPVTEPAVRILCLDGPLAGAQTTVAAGVEEVVLYEQDGTQVRYRIDGVLTVFPGSLYAARLVTG